MTAVKVLLAGECNGQLEQLYKRIQTVNAKSGPFTVLFCVGRFLGDGSADDEPDSTTVDYVTRTEPVAVPTYFIGGYGKGSNLVLNALKSSSCGITYLGRSGVVQVQDLTVAFLDGTYNAAAFNSTSASSPGSPHYSKQDVEHLKAALQQLEGDVDLLLTCEWPQDILTGVPKNLVPSEPCSAEGSAVAAELAQLARPRYHIAAGHHIFYPRPPYISKDLGAGVRATRFVSLAPVGNPTKQKFLHALGLVPASTMTPEQLSQQPDGSTPSPYELATKRPPQEEALASGQDWRWQGSKRQRTEPAVPLGRPGVVKDDRKTVYCGNVAFAASEADLEAFFSRAGQVVDIRRGVDEQGRAKGFCHVQFADVEGVQQALKLHGDVLLGREVRVDIIQGAAVDKTDWGKAVDSCWFCMSSPSFDAELVASIGEAAYLTLDKGPIAAGHVLVVPIEHYPSLLSLSPDAYHEVDRYLSALRSFYAASGQVLVGFERHLRMKKQGGNHCHVNALGVSQQQGANARQVFEQVGQRHGLQLVHLPAGSDPEGRRAALREVVGDDEYLLALLPDGGSLVHRIARGERLQMNVGREMLAELVGRPERADWKVCTSSAQQEAAATAAFKEKFKAYDAVMQE